MTQNRSNVWNMGFAWKSIIKFFIIDANKYVIIKYVITRFARMNLKKIFPTLNWLKTFKNTKKIFQRKIPTLWANFLLSTL